MKSTRPFALFEWMIAIRYLRVSVIAGFSIVGIMLSVAALIVAQPENADRVRPANGDASGGGPRATTDRLAVKPHARGILL